MNSRKTIDVAKGKVESAVAQLIFEARRFPDVPEPWQIRGLLAAGREYGRAIERLSRVRVRS